MRIAICVATFKRPAGLRSLMLGMNRLLRGMDVDFRSVVVDTATGWGMRRREIVQRISSNLRL
jgi:hypothetical protein